MKVIAISGHDSTGKTTLARNLANLITARNLTVSLLPLAHELKADLARLGLPAFEKPTSDPMRDLLRSYGWAARVHLGMLHWLDRWEAAALDLNPDVIIVDDVRHLNEYRWMRDCNAHIITLHAHSTEPRRTPELPPIVTEIWDVRGANLATKGHLPAHQRAAHIVLTRPEDLNAAGLQELDDAFLTPVLGTGPAGHYRPTPRAAPHSDLRHNAQGGAAMPAHDAPPAHDQAAQ